MRVALGVAFVVSLLASTQTPPPPQTQPPAILKSGTGIIMGRVVDADMTTGVSGAAVSISGTALGAPSARFDNGIPGGARIATTNSQGQFLFRELPAGAYTIGTNARGYVPGSYGQTRMMAPGRTPQARRTLELTGTDKPANITIQMWKLGGIDGRVLDEAGEPMVFVDVSVLERVTDWTGVSFQMAGLWTTDDRGAYHVDVKPGDYVVSVLTATTTMPVSGAEAYLQVERDGGTALQKYMAQTTTAGGLVPRAYGTRVDKFVVSQLGFLSAPVVPPMGIERGAAWFYPSAFHPSSLTPAGATIVRVASGEEKTGVDVTMRPAPARRISGRVVGPDGPVGNVRLTLVARDPLLMGLPTPTLFDTPLAVADANGEFAFVGIAPGSYTLTVSRYAAAPAYDDMLWALEPVSVGSETDVSDLEIRLQRGARVSGRVVVETKLAAPPQPKSLVLRVTPTLAPRATAAAMMMVREESASWLDDRQFALQPVPPGPYIIDVSLLSSGWVVKSVTAGGREVADKPFDLGAAGVSDVVVTVTDRISTLSGVARDGNGTPATAATIIVFPTDKTLWPIAGVRSRLVRTTAAAGDGRYEFRGLPAGDYYVVGVDGPALDFSDPTVLTGLTPSASRVTIGDGTAHTQDLRATVRR